MANTKQAAKRARLAIKHRMRNRWQMSRMNTQIKQVLAAIQGADHEKATTEYRYAVSLLDRLVNKGIIHKNKASRHKSRLNAQIKQLATQ